MHKLIGMKDLNYPKHLEIRDSYSPFKKPFQPIFSILRLIIVLGWRLLFRNNFLQLLPLLYLQYSSKTSSVQI